jgi:hypothetical protein
MGREYPGVAGASTEPARKRKKGKKRTTNRRDEKTDAQKVNGSQSEETTDAAVTEHPVCIGLERPGDHVL